MELVQLEIQIYKYKNVNVAINAKKDREKAKKDQCKTFKHGKKQQKALNQWVKVRQYNVINVITL